MFSLFKLIKNILLLFPVLYIFKPVQKILLFLTYYIYLIEWIYNNKKKLAFCDFFTLKRDYNKRFDLYNKISADFNLDNDQIVYLEFGVAAGSSFNFWLNKNNNGNSRFFGFDTFEGLPESWGGFYDKGAMSHSIPTLEDKRGQYIKGLFQDTLSTFIKENINILSSNRKLVVHMDADLYSATLFSLSQLYPFLKKDDIIFFDEFNVPLHEFKAFKEFTECFYINLHPIGSVNNFYQTAFVVK